MSRAVQTAVPSAVTMWLGRLGMGCLLALPLFLTHGRGVAEILVALIALLFVLRTVMVRDAHWLRQGWVPVAGAWWGWLVVCSLPGIGESGMASMMQAVFLGRFLLFVAALEFWLLRSEARRQWMLILVRWATLYIVAQEALQLLIGRNLFGIGRLASGELTGPYSAARAGPVVSRLLFPAVLPVVMRLWHHRHRLAAAGLMLGGVASVVLFGQRMPVLLTALGLLVCGAFLPRLRVLILAMLVAGGGLVASSAILAPPTFERLVTRFSAQMQAWPSSPYGQLAARAVSIAQANPWTGRGFDAFRVACGRGEYWHGWSQVLHGETGWTIPPAPDVGDQAAVQSWLDVLGGGGAICAQHPHNHYLQAVIEAGLPGLALFCAMVIAWLCILGRGLWRHPDPVRVALFAAVLIQEWPIASSSDFVNMPLGGWFFLLLGLGLAQARWTQRPREPVSEERRKGLSQ